MAVHVEELVSEVTVVGGDLPLSPVQLERIAELVLARLDQRERDRCAARAATRLRPTAEPEADR
jgi:hypothetical protein